eukprot:TRINITY_DN111228_c0_g1_i1.p1 TRINITY_DN111228_c0_g1~~TRINITY_DN111228_c0_g1_i1.p1  ORF type:complete len:206 (+),score=31.50 TRINITY_DN111228_c0_g1_i1:91-708(+)
MRGFQFAAALLALELKHCVGAEGPSSCIECAQAGLSWQIDECQPADLGECPVMDVGCCRTVECCVTSGCRAPKERYGSVWASHGGDDLTLSCNQCCTDSEDGCLYRKWTGGAESKVEPWYNMNGIERGHKCSEKFSDCPPCARCSKRAEQELLELKKPADCTCVEGKRYLDPCFSPGSCDCYCQRLAGGLAQCPHLRAQVESREL